eukprot:UN31779
MDIDTSSSHFTTTPIYFSNIWADTSHWTTRGAACVYAATPTGFRIYVHQTGITVANAISMNWQLQWVGLGEMNPPTNSPTTSQPTKLPTYAPSYSQPTERPSPTPTGRPTSSKPTDRPSVSEPT